MQFKVRFETPDVDSRLAELGLKAGVLKESVMQGMLARSEATPNDPPLFAGFAAWARTVRSLREQLIPRPYSWNRSDDGNYPLVVSPNGKIAIAVATGDENTGNPYLTPMTKSPKGPRTQSAIEINQYQGHLFDDMPYLEVPEGPNSDRVTWILLQNHHQALKEVRYELSLPNSYSGKIDGWSERIILGSLPFDPTIVIPIPVMPNLPDIDVPLLRRM